MTASDPTLRRATVMLEKAGKEQKAGIWMTASQMLASPAANRVEVNLGRISRISTKDAAIFVPGKVLGHGIVDKKLVVGAFSFSSSARAKILAVGGTPLSIEQFLKRYPKGSGVHLVR